MQNTPASTSPQSTSLFAQSIHRFNAMYRMQISATPTLRIGTAGPAERLREFKRIMLDEINEVDEIIEKLDSMMQDESKATDSDVLDVLTKMADWFGDIQVYAASEMLKFGLPQDKVLELIMQSNFSKMFDDGPRFDENNKLIKGPNYFKPEPHISRMLLDLINSENTTK